MSYLCLKRVFFYCEKMRWDLSKNMNSFENFNLFEFQNPKSIYNIVPCSMTPLSCGKIYQSQQQCHTSQKKKKTNKQSNKQTQPHRFMLSLWCELKKEKKKHLCMYVNIFQAQLTGLNGFAFLHVVPRSKSFFWGPR